MTDSSKEWLLAPTYDKCPETEKVAIIEMNVLIVKGINLKFHRKAIRLGPNDIFIVSCNWFDE